ncbi:MAG: hypothetical protein ACNS60_06270 [Candidatus Cyclobacteriaceae bacterium M2_1C_046]
MTKYPLITYKSFRHADILMVKGSNTAAVIVKKDYIPINKFKEIFKTLEELVEEKNIDKLIFDKRNMTVFHQPSMEWYFSVWKEKMYDLGLKAHRKILPEDITFQYSVKIGREDISKKYPGGKFHQMDIKYMKDLDEAIEH